MDSDDPNELKAQIDRLKAENQRLRDRLTSGPTRRRAIQAGGLLAGLPALSLLFGSATAQSGTIPDPADPAFTKFRGDRLRFVPRTSDVSSPDDGVATYRSDK